MPISLHYDKPKQLTIFKAVGDLSFEDFRMSMTNFYEDPTRDVLCDFSDASLSRLTLEDINAILNIAEQNAEKRPSGKTAIVAPEDANFGVSSMIQGYSHNLPLKIMVFRTIEEATEWLDTDE